MNKRRPRNLPTRFPSSRKPDWSRRRGDRRRYCCRTILPRREHGAQEKRRASMSPASATPNGTIGSARIGSRGPLSGCCLPQSGPQQWVDRTLAEHRSMLDAIRRRFEMLRAQRTRLRKQQDGDELDLEAYIDSHADYRAGLPMARRRSTRRSVARSETWPSCSSSTSAVPPMAGFRPTGGSSTSSAKHCCWFVLRLEGMGEPYSVQAFSGKGPHAVTVRTIKQFDEQYGNDTARRIAALEPEQYTRAGAAIRHSSTMLMREPAAHRLLLLLSDGKPNDVDRYDGRYGLEDTRQAVTEAKLQGIFPFCLTVDRTRPPTCRPCSARVSTRSAEAGIAADRASRLDEAAGRHLTNQVVGRRWRRRESRSTGCARLTLNTMSWIIQSVRPGRCDWIERLREKRPHVPGTP